MQFKSGNGNFKELKAFLDKFTVSEPVALGGTMNFPVPPTVGATGTYGLINRVKNPGKKIKKITSFQQGFVAGGVLNMKLVSQNMQTVYAETTAKTTKSDGSMEVVEFIFPVAVNIPEENFYVTVYSSTTNVKVTDFHNNDTSKTTLATADATYGNYYYSVPTADWKANYYKPSPVTSYYMALNFFYEELNILPNDETVDMAKLVPDLQEMLDTFGGFIDPVDISLGRSLTTDSIPVINSQFYGYVNRIKKLPGKIGKITFKQKSTVSGSEYRCKVMNDARNITYGYATAYTTKADGSIEDISFVFDTPIEITEDFFYVSIYSPTTNIKVDAYGTNTANNPLVVGATDAKPTYYFPNPESTGTGSWATSPKDGYYMWMEFYSREDNVLPLDGSIPPEKLNRSLRELIGLYDKSTLAIFMPKKVYTWGEAIKGDFEGVRVPKVGVYLDHALPWGHQAKNAKFDGVVQKNRLDFFTPYPIDYTLANINNALTKQEITRTYKITGDNINPYEGSITHVSVKNNVGADKVVRLLTIGDSTVAGANAFILDQAGNKLTGPFWHLTAREFAMDSIAVNDPNKYKFLAVGTRLEGTNGSQGGADTVTYLGQTRTIFTSTNGESGSKIADHLRYRTQKRPSQETWDLLGLGNGTHTDYTGTAAQKDLIAQTNEAYGGTEADYTGNPFYDAAKTGNNRFSIAKWLERFRTHDDNGNKLTLGSGTGTKITAANIDKMNVCTPTHVLIQTGLNDWSQVSVTQYIADMQVMINELKAQIPGVKIAFSLFPDDPGTYFPELYPDISDSAMRYLHGSTRPYVTALQDTFASSADVDLLPFYFVMPPAVSLSYRWMKTDDGRMVKAPFGPASNDYHANRYAHQAWSHQLYAWIKTTLVV